MKTKPERIWRARWRTMVFRCENPRSQKFSSYGGRGIRIDPAIRDWEDFWTFVKTLPGWDRVHLSGRSLDRIDNDGPYSPGNLRLASGTQQRENQRPLPLDPPAVKAGDRCGSWTATGDWVLRSRKRRGKSTRTVARLRLYGWACHCGNIRYYVKNYIQNKGIRECNACTGRRGAAVRWGKL